MRTTQARLAARRARTGSITRIDRYRFRRQVRAVSVAFAVAVTLAYAAVALLIWEVVKV